MTTDELFTLELRGEQPGSGGLAYFAIVDGRLRISIEDASEAVLTQLQTTELVRWASAQLHP